MTQTEPKQNFQSSSPIRPLQATDVEPLRQLLIETAVFDSEEIKIALELIQITLDKPEQKDYIIRVFEDENGVLGYYCIGPTPATDSTYDLYWIAVKPTAQGKGIGRILNSHAEDLIRSRNGKLVIAETSSTPRYELTRKFYLRNNYLELARIKNYYHVEDDLVIFGKYL